MEINYSVAGAKRKELVKAVSNALDGWTIRYLGAPSMSYQVGDFEITRTGVLRFSDRTDTQLVESVLEALDAAGFESAADGKAVQPPAGEEIAPPAQDGDGTAARREEDEESQPPVEIETGNCHRLVISVPGTLFDETARQNLRKLVDGKAELIKKALNVEKLPIEFDPEKITFRWFIGRPEPDDAKAYAQLIDGLCRKAREQKRVNAKEKEVPNEKYAFRCFLLSLGFIGPEYKKTRRILLRNLSGSSAFRDGKKKEENSNELSGQGTD